MGFVSGKYDVDLPKWADNALLLDTLRGNHSTGAVFVKEGEAAYYKRAVPGHDFIHLPVYKRIKDAGASFFIGHNRAATMGAVNDNNAHPFECGDWIGVHNGSLKHGWKTYLGQQYDVDSEAIIAHIDEHGLKETLEKLEGAYSLVLYNVVEEKLYFARNDERPMHLVFCKSEQMFYGSELDLVRAATVRNRFYPEKEVQTKVGTIYSIDASLSFKEEDTFTVKKPQTTSIWYGGKPTNQSASVSRGTHSGAGSKAVSKAPTNVAKGGSGGYPPSFPGGEKPYKPKDVVECYFTRIEPWGNDKSKFKVVGFVDDEQFTPMMLADVSQSVGEALVYASEAVKIEVGFGMAIHQQEACLVGKVDEKEIVKQEGVDERCGHCLGVMTPEDKVDMFMIGGQPVCHACCVENHWVEA